ncbi:MAG: proline dehydrogenase family protein [Actinomycetota bacterium]
MRRVIMTVADRPAIRRLMTGGVGRRVALRFVAGEDLEDALKVVNALNERGMMASIDYLGENVTDATKAAAATDAYLDAIQRVEAAGLRANQSAKLTQMGLDIDEEFALGNAAVVAARAAESGSALTLDMEDHRYTGRTIDTVLRLAHRYPERIGVAVQAYLHRSPADVDRLNEARVQVRICKGAYREPRRIAYQRKAEVDAAFAKILVRLLEANVYPMIATHDSRLVGFALRQVNILGRDRETFEFQFLLGVRRDLQERLVAEGYRVRVYVPFGSEWYPYFRRRLAERPANLVFFARQLLRG